jgi:hypothetical protein
MSLNFKEVISLIMLTTLAVYLIVGICLYIVDDKSVEVKTTVDEYGVVCYHKGEHISCVPMYCD